MENKESLLLHSCCGPCSTSVIEKLSKEFNVTVFFYNPNITDEEEYLRRKEAQLLVLKYFNDVNILDDDYQVDEYFNKVRGYENDKEGRGRCSLCFQLRLEETARRAVENGFQNFATTLTVSPHKNYSIISAIGVRIANKYGIKYYDGNFKKADGYKRSIDLSKEMKLYRQNYCGCKFSKWF